ncbi:biosynthetic-type acetolactate synthase large subunit [Synechococcus elongatus]|uniref:Acetolactate synthase n=1 Tax=Synechococcus elongatus (strain ATCC 33912 / PCC 7942 / FACHB-805) TaxID=1140 RepID=Q31RZ8_SYNE7|nr:biosynthetic-type acetolactate synthase large subunit [Synechococcus elongatus]MBD2689071.1 biosynthetic-type acetolactate synthase large subunit [Synechococcus elongatus FACHB-1061]prf//1611501A acetolactate synthase [Synechococcus sp.]ABB56171.1 acetolactate synthase, large subunit [Synechococcus elongatus PCC 7942 = FACHB-805]AJD56776.1 acetolactate synthase catalytic subunit [Synechococcus elongatus UTEX 2973]MBD2588003.1 biosynthetic-type acetolactate synthase large subunit [Synechococ
MQLQTVTIQQRATGAYALIDSLCQHGVKHIFGYPGGAILPIYDELHRAEAAGRVQHILVRHEQGAVHAADAYSRATGEVGVCFATSGPGATNLVTGIATAQMDSIPMVVVTGQVPRTAIGTDAFQETDIYGITLPIVKHSYVVRDPRDMARIVAEAFHIAQSGRPGPVLIDVPKDVGTEEFDYVPVAPGDIRLPGYRPTTRGNPRQIAQAIALVKVARRPLLYVGGGAITAGAHAELRAFAERFQLPVTTTLMGKGAFDERHPLALGMLGMHGTAYANFAVSECDLLIAVGARFDDRVTGKLDEFASKAQVIHVDIDPAEVGKNRVPEVPIVGDVRQVLNELLARAEEQISADDATRTQPWLDRIAYWKREYPLQIPYYADVLSPQQVIHSLGEAAPDAYFTTDVGQHQMWAAQFIKNGPRRWISSAGLGTMGFGMPAAMGAQMALPDDTVICVAGDASILMNIQELGTLAQYNIPIKVVVVNNGWQGMVRQWQEAFYDERYSNSNMERGMPDFVKLAEAFGIKGMRVSHPDELQAAIAEMLAFDGPVFLDAIVKRDENCYPMVPSGHSNAQMLGLPKDPTLDLDLAIATCSSCGAKTLPSHKFCPDCGAKL